MALQRTMVSSGALAVALLWSSGAIAQGAADTATGATQVAPVAPASASDTASAADATARASNAGLADIIVTANRRTENVQKSSLDIAVVSGASLGTAGVTKAADLQSLVPSLTISASGTANATFVRGVGSFATDAAADGSIAYNINGVFISRPNGIGSIFFDLDRVEVLKGPQGTLYGRNASGGAINLITKRPTSQFSADASAEIGNYGERNFFLAAGGPVTDTLGVRFAIQRNKHDGYLTDGYDDQDDIAARLTALWKPTAALSVLVIGEYMHQQGKGSGAVYRSSRTANPADPYTGPSLSPQPEAGLIGPDKLTNDGFVNSTVAAISAEMNWDLGPATLTFIPAYRDTKPTTLTYDPGFYFNTAETSQTQSYELRLGHQSRALSWVLGGYYFHENQTEHYLLLARPIQENTVDATYHTKSYAFFGQATYSILDNLRLIAGARYSNDNKSQGGSSTSFLPVPVTTSNDGHRVDGNTSFKAGAEYDLTPQNMLYGTVSTGYKAGGFVPAVPAPANSYKPEKLTAYTAGIRNRFFDNKLQVNVEGFYWKYHNKQERYLGEVPGGATGLLTTNAGQATLYGADVDITAKISKGTLRINGEYLHTRYGSFSYPVVNAGPFAPLGYSTLATTCAIGPLTIITPVVSQQTINCAGKPLPHAPKWTGSISYDYPIHLSDADTLTPAVAARGASSMYLSPDFISSAEDNGYVSVDLSVTYQHRALSITGWVRNLTQQVIYSGGYRYPFSFHEPFGDPTLFYADIRPPRTYGVTIKFSY